MKLLFTPHAEAERLAREVEKFPERPDKNGWPFEELIGLWSSTVARRKLSLVCLSRKRRWRKSHHNKNQKARVRENTNETRKRIGADRG